MISPLVSKTIYSFSIINEINDVVFLKRNWDQLLDVSSFDTIYSTHEWVTAWWLSFSTDSDKLKIITATREGELVFIAPFMISTVRKYGFLIKVLRIIGTPNADHNDLLVKWGEEGVFPLFWEFIQDKIPGWSQLHLVEMQENSSFARWLQKTQQNVYQEKGSECPYITLTEWETWEEYFGSLSKNFRKSTRKKRNRLFKGKNSSFNCIKSVTPDMPELKAARRLEGKSTKATKIDHLVLADKKSFSFQKRLMAAQGAFDVLLFSLEIDNEMVSYRYGYEYKKKYYSYNTSYADSVERYSPGLMVLERVLKYCIDNLIVEYDFLRGASQHKGHWTKKTRQQHNYYFLKKNLENKLYTILVFNLRPFLKKNLISIYRKVVLYTRK